VPSPKQQMNKAVSGESRSEAIGWESPFVKINTDVSNSSFLLIYMLATPTDDQVSEFLLKLDFVYRSSPAGFGIFIDLSAIQVSVADFWIALKIGMFFSQMDMALREKPTQGIVIITESEVVCEFTNQVVSMFNSPVPVSCCSSMHEARQRHPCKA
jgi:hypothetical protein